jgi:two-component system, LuxR family, sensor kinase FixL
MNSHAAPAILIVEDERIVAKDLQRSLSDMGYDAFAIADCAEEAVACASARCPDVVLVDIRIKGQEDGIRTAEILKKKFPVIVIFLTAHADEAMLDRAKRTEPHGYLVKPVKEAELRSMIEISLYKLELERAREGLRASQQRLFDITDNVPVSIGYFDREGRVQFANRAFRDVVQYRNDEMGVPASAFLGDALFKESYPPRQRALKGEHVRFVVNFERNGAARKHEVTYFPNFDSKGYVVGIYAIGYDVTDVRRSHEQIRNLTQRLESVREEERRAVAVVLHDGIAQDLFAMKLGLNHLEVIAKRQAAVKKVCRELTAAVTKCMENTRQIANELRPVALAYSRVSTVIMDHAQHFGRRSNLNVKINESAQFPNLDEPAQLLLFRTAQEALNNVARHAHATTVEIALHAEDGRVTMDITDDGIGITEAAMSKAHSLGLLGLRERYAALGGGLAARRREPTGTTLTAYLPLAR